MKKLKFILAATAALLLTAMVFQYGCKKAELEKTDSNQQIAEAGIGKLVSLLHKWENGVITDEEFFTQLQQVMAGFEGGIESLPPGLRNLPDQALVGMINSSKSDAFKVTILLLQDDLSETVAIAATNAGLKKDMFAETIPPAKGPINTDDITVTSDRMLEFRSITAFETTMNSLVNHVEADIDVWEKSIGFTSMRRNFEIIKEDPAVNDLTIDNSRIESIYFESILNPDAKVQIADSIYQYDFDKDLVRIINAATGEVVRSLDLGNDDRALGACWGNAEPCIETEVPIAGSSSTLIFIGKKWNRWYFTYAEVGAWTKSYKKTATQTKAYSLYLHIMIDQWHKLRFKLCNFGPYFTVSSHQFVGTTAALSRAYHWNTGFPTARRYEVPEWGRTHHWGDKDFVNQYWDYDCHIDVW